MRYVRQGLKEFFFLCGLGIGVACMLVLLLKLDYVENIDRYASDILIRHAAEQDIRDKEPKFFFINVGEPSCRSWAIDKHTSCTLDWSTPRDRLAKILSAITEYIKGHRDEAPKLTVIDIELAPQPRAKTSDATGSPNKASLSSTSCSTTANAAAETRDSSHPSVSEDCNLRQKVFDLLEADRSVPLITIRPMVIDPNPAHTLAVSGFRSILDPDFPGESRPDNLWFASAIVQSDADGVVRSVHGWDMHSFEMTHPTLIAGIGLLGAALLESPPETTKLACLFTGSVPNPKSCPREKIQVGGRDYGPNMGRDWSEVHRIGFSIPYDNRKPTAAKLYNVEIVEASDFEKDSGKYSKLLEHAVVVIGGSYLASGDLRTTPLGSGMPGAMVHINAIRAYHTGRLLEEGNFITFWRVKLTLIVVAAIVGAFVYVLRSFIPAAVPRILLSFVGVAAAATAVLGVGSMLTYEDLMAGTVIGTFTPALAAAFEGLSDVLHQIKQLLGLDVEPQLTLDTSVAVLVSNEVALPNTSPNDVA
jgi:CHASE2 domain-containing sensor protein